MDRITIESIIARKPLNALKCVIYHLHETGRVNNLSSTSFSHSLDLSQALSLMRCDSLEEAKIKTTP